MTNFSTSTKQLAEAVDAAARVVRGNALSWGESATICVEADRVAVRGMGAAMGISAVVLADVKKSGDVQVNARDMVKRLRALRGESVRVTRTPKAVKLESDGQRYTLPTFEGTMPSEPVWPSYALSVPTAPLLEAYARAGYAACRDETRSHLHGVLLVLSGFLMVVSTDGHRIAIAKVDADGVPEAESILVPLACVAEMVRMAKRCERIDVLVNDSRIFVRSTTEELWCLRPQGTFPPYDRVIPDREDDAIEVDPGALAAAVRAAGVIRSGNSSPVRLVVAEHVIRVTARDASGGEYHEAVPCVYGGQERTVGVQAEYLAEPLLAMGGEAVTMGICGETDPVVIRSGNGATAVVMPLRLD